MNKTVRLELPYPPSVNSYWLANGKRRYISPAGVQFTKSVIQIVRENSVKSFGDKQVAINVMIHPRSKRRFDLDNTLKAILDSLQKAGVYDDDSQIEYIEIARGEQVEGGKAVIYLYDYIGEEHGGR